MKADGELLEGTWINGYMEGYGRQIFKNEFEYTGEFKLSKKHGTGTCIWKCGKIYKGHWQDDIMQGYGIIEFGDGRKYLGEVFDGKMHGHGIYEW